jgi:glucose 1-dehydrogenase
VIADVMKIAAANGVICLVGVGHTGRTAMIPAAELATTMVLRNTAVFGIVNANRRHWDNAVASLARADRSWLSRLISRREQPRDFVRALNREADDIKVIIEFAGI